MTGFCNIVSLNLDHYDRKIKLCVNKGFYRDMAYMKKIVERFSFGFSRSTFNKLQFSSDSTDNNQTNNNRLEMISLMVVMMVKNSH